MISWQSLRGYGLDTLVWWEQVVKPGIRKLGIKRSKELNMEKRESLNLLMLRQCYLTRKIQLGMTSQLSELKTIHIQIEQWYQKESEKIQHQSRVKEFQNREKPLYITMNFTRGPSKGMQSLNCRQTMVLLKVIPAVHLIWKSLLRIFSSTLQLLIYMPSKYFWMR